MTMNGKHVATLLECSGRGSIERHQRVAGGIAAQLLDLPAVQVDVGVFIMMDQQLKIRCVAGSSENSRRSQMSGVFHSVETMEPGVARVPNPLFPLLHVVSSKPGLRQSDGGDLVVNDQADGVVWAEGTSVLTAGSGP